MDSPLENLALRAKDGDKNALEEIVRRIQHRIFGLSLRMLGYPADAEDAAQEIIIKIITHLSEFRGECSFLFWACRIASNHLLTARKQKAEENGVSLDLLEDMIGDHHTEYRLSVHTTPETDLLRAESRATCVQTLLISLDRDERLAFILGEIFEFNSKEGAFILDVSPEAFRKRLSRGRARIRGFMLRNCGLVNNRNPCHCDRRVSQDLQNDMRSREPLLFVSGNPPQNNDYVLRRLRELNEVERVAFLFRTYPDYAPPDSFVEFFKDLIESGAYRILTD